MSSTEGRRVAAGGVVTLVLDWGGVAAGPGRLVLSFTLLFIEFIGVIH